jgi:hypothetical protein
MMFAATITLGALLIGRVLSEGLRFSSLWVIIAVVLFTTLMIFGLTAHEYGTLMLDSAGILQEKFLDLDEVEFKRYAVTITPRELGASPQQRTLDLLKTLASLARDLLRHGKPIQCLRHGLLSTNNVGLGLCQEEGIETWSRHRSPIPVGKERHTLLTTRPGVPNDATQEDRATAPDRLPDSGRVSQGPTGYVEGAGGG